MRELKYGSQVYVHPTACHCNGIRCHGNFIGSALPMCHRTLCVHCRAEMPEPLKLMLQAASVESGIANGEKGEDDDVVEVAFPTRDDEPGQEVQAQLQQLEHGDCEVVVTRTVETKQHGEQSSAVPAWLATSQELQHSPSEVLPWYICLKNNNCTRSAVIHIRVSLYKTVPP